MGWRYDEEGSIFRDNALSWTADALGSVSFTVEIGTRSGRPLQNPSWTMFNIEPGNNAQAFSATDTRGFSFLCERLVESGRVPVTDSATGFTTYSDCFHAPGVCPAR